VGDPARPRARRLRLAPPVHNRPAADPALVGAPNCPRADIAGPLRLFPERASRGLSESAGQVKTVANVSPITRGHSVTEYVFKTNPRMYRPRHGQGCVAMFGLDFARTTMWFVPTSAPLLHELIEAATNGGDADGLDRAAPQTRYSENEGRSDPMPAFQSLNCSSGGAPRALKDAGSGSLSREGQLHARARPVGT
jgi:hypothetical protein